MRIQSKVWVSIVSSVTVSVVIGALAFSILRSINEDLSRSQRYNAIIIKAVNLNNLIDNFRADPGRRYMQQTGDVRQSLEGLLADVSSREGREDAILSQMRRNTEDLGPLLDQFFAREGTAHGLGGDVEAERRALLASQLLIKVRFLADDADRLLHISQDRIEEAQRRIIAAVLFLIVAVILTNGVISYTSSRAMVRKILQLNAGAKRIADGDLDQPVAVRRGDELGELAASFNDMTAALQASYGQLRRSNRELREFTRVASHDLQEPLRKVRAFGDRLRQESGGCLNEASLDYLSRMENAAGRMQDLIDALLTYSSLAARQETFQPTDLNLLAGEVIGDLEVRIAETGGRVEVEDLPTIEADGTQMRQLLQNLIGNGLKYHRPGVPPVIQVCGRRLDGSGQVCEISVSDNGIGFDERYLDRIFSPFQRLHGRTKFQGTGIGLAIVRKIVERHNGTVTARSEPDKGSTFIVTLPVSQQAGQQAGQ